jgi:hypothetical protein
MQILLPLVCDLLSSIEFARPESWDSRNREVSHGNREVSHGRGIC